MMGKLWCNDEPLALPQTLQGLLHLWYHEYCRVFEDRLVNSEDRQWFERLLDTKLPEFGCSRDEVLGDKPLLYGDFMTHNSETKIYDQIDEYDKVSVGLSN